MAQLIERWTSTLIGECARPMWTKLCLIQLNVTIRDINCSHPLDVTDWGNTNSRFVG